MDSPASFQKLTNWDNDEKDWQTWTCNFERRFRYRGVVDLNSLLWHIPNDPAVKLTTEVAKKSRENKSVNLGSVHAFRNIGSSTVSLET